MNCSIKDTTGGKILSNLTRPIEPGYFDTPAFIKRFGEWRPGKLSEAQIAENAMDVLRFHKDGSPKIDVNEFGFAFYIDKKNVRVNILQEEFKTLPLEVRDVVSSEIMNVMVSDLMLNHLSQNDEFLAGKQMEGFSLEAWYQEKVEDFVERGVSQMVVDSLNESRADYLDGLRAKLKNLGVKTSNDAVKQVESIERPTTDKASPAIKAIMEFVPKVDSQGEIIESTIIPYAPVFMKPSEVWGVILENMANIPMESGKNMVKVYMDRLTEMKSLYPWVDEIIQQIEAGGIALKIQFVTALNNVRNNPYVTEVLNGNFSTKNATGSTTTSQKVSREWTLLFNTTMLGTKTEEKEIIAYEEITDAQDRIEEVLITQEGQEDRLLDTYKAFNDAMSWLNIPITEEIFFKTFSIFAEDTVKNTNEEINYLNAMKSFQLWLKNDILPIASNAVLNTNETTTRNLMNNLGKFAKAKVSIDSDNGVHMVTLGDKRIYIYSLPSVLQETINLWKNNPDMVKDLALDPSIEDSMLIKFLSDPTNLAQISVGNRGVISTVSRGTRKSHDGKKISKGDYAKVDLYNVLRLIKNERGGIFRRPIYNTQVPADKGNEFQLEIPGFLTEYDAGPSTINNASELAKYNKSADRKVAEDLKSYVKNEFSKMQSAVWYISDVIDEMVAKHGSEGIQQYFANKLPGKSSAAALSELVISIQDDLAKVEEVEALIEKASSKMIMVYHLHPKDGLIITRPSKGEVGSYQGRAFTFTIADSLNNVPGLKNPISNLPLPNDKIILDSDVQLSNAILNVLEKAFRNKREKYTNEVEEKYGITISDDLDGPVGIDKDVYNYYRDKGLEQGTTGTLNRLMTRDLMMRDFVANYMISKIEYAQLFTGGINFYKNLADYIKRVPATYVNGLQPVTGIEEGDEYFTQVTFKTEDLNGLELSYDPNLSPEIQAHYAEVDRTDAQAYITPDRWRRLMLSTGKLSPSAIAVFEKMVAQTPYFYNNEPLPEELILTPKEVKLLSAQPLKGVYFKNEIGGSPTYLKYSQAVLLPQFVMNNPKARTLLEYMDDNGIDEMVAQTGVKVGAMKPITLFDKEGNFVAPENPVKVTLDSKNWRLQQDLPTKTMKDTKIGVQVQKIIMSGLAFSGENELLREIEDALANLSNIGLEEFGKKYGVDVRGGSARIKNLSTFYKALIKDLEAKEVPENNVIRALKAETSMSLLPMLKEQLQNQVFSAVRKAATNLMTPGGSFIQISDQLIGKTEIERRGITMLIDDLDRLKPPMVIDGETSDGIAYKRLQPGQVLIPHSMLVKYLPDYREMSPSDLRKAIPRSLRQIIGYRIPTQAKASVDLLDVVGILPESLGDSIITYGEITAKTGSDFDIDKMYFMAPEMYLSEGRLKMATKGVKGARNKVISLFTKALSNVNSYKEMMTSVDNDTFKSSTLSMIDTAKSEDLDAWDPIRAIETRFAYRTGGTGVAQSANSLSDHILTQGREVRIGFNQGTWGNTNLDAEFSEELTNEELKLTLNLLNKKRVEKKSSELTLQEASDKFKQVKISGTLSELINAFVDIANEDAFVTRGNWGDVTNGYGMMMIRQGIHPTKVSAILRQPVMVELVDDILSKEGLIANEASWKLEEALWKKWKNRAINAGYTKEDLNFLDAPFGGKLDTLKFDALLEVTTTQDAVTKEQILNQLIVLQNYRRVKEVVKKYNAYVTNSKNDAKGAGRNVADMFVRTNKLSDAFFFYESEKNKPELGIKNAHEKFFNNDGSPRLSAIMYDNTTGFLTRLISDNPEMFDSISNETFELFNKAAAENRMTPYVDSVDSASFLFEEFASFQLSGFGPLTKEDTFLEEKGFIDQLVELKTRGKYELINKMLVEELQESQVDSEEPLIFFKLSMEGTAQKSQESKNALTNSWRWLLEENPALGDYLVRKAYRQSGFKPGPNQFHTLIPFEWFLEKDFQNYITTGEFRTSPDDRFLRQAVRRDNSTDFFKYILANKSGDYYIINVSEDQKMGSIGAGKHKIYKTPKFAVTDANVPIELLGLVKVQDGKKDPITRAIYMPLAKPTASMAHYDTDIASFSAEMNKILDEPRLAKGWKEVAKKIVEGVGPNVSSHILDVDQLYKIKFGGESFFTKPGQMLNLKVNNDVRQDIKIDEETASEQNYC